MRRSIQVEPASKGLHHQVTKASITQSGMDLWQAGPRLELRERPETRS